jgi:DNA-binding SARP family transcriptional activator/TolB-like protein/Tfp pilus assembly protein PilF
MVAASGAALVNSSHCNFWYVLSAWRGADKIAAAAASVSAMIVQQSAVLAGIVLSLTEAAIICCRKIWNLSVSCVTAVEERAPQNALGGKDACNVWLRPDDTAASVVGGPQGVGTPLSAPHSAGPVSGGSQFDRQNPAPRPAPSVKNALASPCLDTFAESFVASSPMSAPPTRSLAVLGPFALRIDGCEITGMPRKAQALIAFLALQPGRRMPREIVADLLWSQSGSEQARHSLRQMLLVLRKTPAGSLVGSNPDALWIEPAALTVDAVLLEAGLTVADEAALSHCAALYRGALLEGFPPVSPGFDEWLLPERARLAGAAAQTLWRLAAVQIAASGFDAAAETAARLVAMEALDEAAHRLLIDCLARAGRRAEALQQFEACASLLRAELDVTPDSETVALAERIRAGPLPPKVTGGPPIPTAAPAARVASPEDRDTPRQRPATNAAASIAAEPVGPTVPPTGQWYRTRQHFGWTAVVLCFVIVALGVLASRSSPVPPPGIMVAQFRNVSSVPANDIVLAGFGDLMKMRLAMQDHLRLSEDADGTTENVAADGDRGRAAPGTRYLLEGSVALTNKAIYVSVRLTDIRHETQLWSDHYDRLIVDAIVIADDIAAHVARAVSQDHEVAVDAPRLPGPDRRRLARELLALGNHIDYHAAADGRASREIYRLALQIDQDDVDVMAHLGNADLRSAYASWPMDQTALADADAMLRHATQLDPTNLFVLFNLCQLRRVQGRIPEAIGLCKRALDVDPRYPGALRELGHLALESGDAAQAITWYQASIDAAPTLPNKHIALKGLGVASLALGRSDDAITYLRKSVEADLWHVGNARVWLAAALEMNGQDAEAAKLLGEFMSKHVGLQVDAGYLMLLNAPTYADRQKDVLAALASARQAN